ncbi:calcyphosin-like protein [Lineus longissimus]|uniref:calcyphosin-like protein n=1 Tax=Lineus longissimus TaxID=88925 RepID=UPI002B4F08C3
MSGLAMDSDGPHTAVLEKIRAGCLKRGPSGIKSIQRTFKIYDDSGNKQLEKCELRKGLADYGLTISETEVDSLLDYFDKDHSGSLSFDEFLQMLRPPMSDSRIKLINAAFDKLDKSGDGVITPADMKGIYNARKHPKYLNGQWEEKQVFEDFLKTFEPDESQRDGKVTREEFLAYYSGVSASIDQDCYFDLMMRNSWKL